MAMVILWLVLLVQKRNNYVVLLFLYLKNIEKVGNHL